MTIEEMKARKKELGYSNKTLAEKTGVPLGTLQKIFSGKTVAPREDTISALTSILTPDSDKQYYKMPKTDVLMAKERSEAYSVKECYTLEDYYALPEDQRVELIDGRFYYMSAPSNRHQAVAGFLFSQFLEHVRKHKGSCYPFIAPNDVQLDCDDRTMVQPDVGIICDRSKYIKSHIYGAPDLVVEVLSPSTRKKDLYLKLHKYCSADVREYWLIDTDKKIVVQYDLEGEDLFPRIYGQEDMIPVLIWGGALKIDLREMWESLDFML